MIDNYHYASNNTGRTGCDGPPPRHGGAAGRRLKHLAVDEDKTLQQLGVEALEMLLESRSST